MCQEEFDEFEIVKTQDLDQAVFTLTIVLGVLQKEENKQRGVRTGKPKKHLRSEMIKLTLRREHHTRLIIPTSAA